MTVKFKSQLTQLLTSTLLTSGSAPVRPSTQHRATDNIRQHLEPEDILEICEVRVETNAVGCSSTGLPVVCSRVM
ncbi:hypothetical protein BGZ63DRAFT_394664, partial [Mariannaea sp. PMI_226]